MEDNSKKINDLAKDVLKLSRNSLLINLRFMDKAISMLSVEAVSELQGVMVDGKSIYYDPVYVLKKFSSDGREYVTRQYLHMILHCVYQHFWVSTFVDEKYWNLACDIAVEYTINDIDVPGTNILDAIAQKKEITILMDKVKYMTADLLYKYFVTSPPSDEYVKRLQKLFCMDIHDVWYIRNNKNKADSQDGNENKTESENGGQQKKTGTGYKKNIDIYYNYDGLQNMIDQVDKWKDVAKQMKLDMETFSKRRGIGSDGLTQNLMAVTREKYDYKDFLKKFAVLGENMKINDDEFDYIFYTYGLNLYKKMPLIEPLEYKDVKQVREIAIAIDTSGSTSGKLVQAFVQKTYNILKEQESFSTRFNLHIIQCDDRVQQDTKITNQNELDDYIAHMKIIGLGGTDFRPVFSYVDELIEDKEFINLKGLIYFTDGCGLYPEKQPTYKTAVVYIDDEYNNPEVPVWAIKLVLQTEDILQEESNDEY